MLGIPSWSLFPWEETIRGLLVSWLLLAFEENHGFIDQGRLLQNRDIAWLQRGPTPISITFVNCFVSLKENINRRGQVAKLQRAPCVC
ncbi:unnamed protein product [Victoria cruziana]